MHINAGFGDYTGWYFDKNGALVVGSSEFNGWLGGFIPCPSSLLLNRTSAMLCYAMLRRSANVWYLGAASVRLVARTTAFDVEVFDFRDYASVQLRAGGFGEGGVLGGFGMGDVGFIEMRR